MKHQVGGVTIAIIADWFNTVDIKQVTNGKWAKHCVIIPPNMCF